MQGNEQVIEVLNAGLTIELTAINQYFVQAKMCQNWGLNRLGDKHQPAVKRVLINVTHGATLYSLW